MLLAFEQTDLTFPYGQMDALSLEEPFLYAAYL